MNSQVSQLCSGKAQSSRGNYRTRGGNTPVINNAVINY